MIRSITFSLCLLICSIAMSQKKYERETGISKEEVPSAALKFMESYELPNKVKWFLEESLTGFSYEAKTKIDGYWHSIEFDSTGQFEDVEIRMKEKEVPDEVSKKIHEYLSSNCDHYKISKIQFQLSGELKDLKTFMTIDHSRLKRQYELILFTKNKGKSSWCEMTFSEDGTFVNRRELVFKNLDNIEN